MKGKVLGKVLGWREGCPKFLQLNPSKITFVLETKPFKNGFRFPNKPFPNRHFTEFPLKSHSILIFVVFLSYLRQGRNTDMGYLRLYRNTFMVI